MSRRQAQLRLTRSAKRVEMTRLTHRQRALLKALRWEKGPHDALRLGELLGYAYPREACDRLVARGLAEKVSPGYYRARVVRERR